MIRITGMVENNRVTQPNDIRSVNEKLIKFLSKDDDLTIITFIDGSKIWVEESIKTLDARINAAHKEDKK